MNRVYGRKYVIQWDEDVGRYHVTLGGDSVGFHKTEDGAKALASAHARQVTLPGAYQSYSVTVEPRYGR